MITLLSPEDGAVLSTLTPVQRDFYEHYEEYSVPEYDWRTKSGVGAEDVTIPDPYRFAWETDEENAVFLLKDEKGNTVYRQEGGTSAEVYNLLIGKTYSWQVGSSEIRHFTTDGTTPRWIRLDGTFNVRDIGGYRTTDGKVIKQGLLYRGCEMDRALFITEEGIRAAREDLGIRTDLDLRGERLGITTESPLGPDIRFEIFHTYAYGECIDLPEGMAAAKKVFDVLSDPDAYPIFLHCAAGADRTGTFAYLMQALLGVSDDELDRDYEMTTLSNQNPKSRHSPFYRSLIDDLNKHGHDTKSRVETYLTKCCGVSEEAIARIRALFLSDDNETDK